MAIEKNDLLEVLGMNQEYEDAKAFRAAFESKFTSKTNIDEETIKAATGKVIGSSTVAYKRKLKELGVEVPKDLLESDFEKLLVGGLDLATNKFKAEIEEATKKVVPDERVTVLEAEVNKWKSKHAEEVEAKGQVQAKLQETENNWAAKFKNHEKGLKLRDEQGKIKWKANISDIEKKGFGAMFDEKYNIDLSEDGSLVPMDKQGKRIPHPKKTGEFASLSELYEIEGLQAGVWEVNPHEKKQPASQTKQTIQFQQNNNNSTQRTAAPRLI